MSMLVDPVAAKLASFSHDVSQEGRCYPVG
jgi:hypothetical protein